MTGKSRGFVWILALSSVALPHAAPAHAQTLTCHGATANFVGTSGDDEIVGSVNDDVIAAGPGDDVVHGGGGHDLICGGGGNDRLFGDSGGSGQTIYGGRGRDLVDGADSAYGGPGNDHLRHCTCFSDRGDDTFSHGVVWFFRTDHDVPGVRVDLRAGTANSPFTGHDRLVRIHNVVGTDANDVILGTADDDIMDGGRGNDRIRGRDGDDLILGDRGHDLADSGSGMDECRHADIYRRCENH